MSKEPDKLKIEDNEFFKNLPPEAQEEIRQQKRKEVEACLQREKLLWKIAFTGAVSGALLAALAAVMNGNNISLMVIVCSLYGAFAGFLIGRLRLNHVLSTILFGFPLLTINLFCVMSGLMNSMFVTLIFYPGGGLLIPFLLEKHYQELEPF